MSSSSTQTAGPAEDEGEEGASVDTFCEYQPTGLPASIVACYDGIPSHTSSACESALLSSVSAPGIDETAAAAVHSLLVNRQLSPLQAEGVLLAIQRHRRVYPANGQRAGFFLGDGAGIGKGRQIAAIVRDAFSRRDVTKRHLWLSVSRELIVDAKRDLGHVGVHCDIHDAIDLLSNKGAALGKANRGVLFITYPFLVSNNRLQQILHWCADSSSTAAEQAYNGCIVFDEAHKAKNLANDSKTAQLVLQLQRRLPNARVLYCSATGVSDVAHLAYAERLGLWNTTSVTSIGHFPTFAAFHQSLTSRGLGALELLALELKQQGSFLARTLSWEGARFETMQIPLSHHHQATYDLTVQWWNTLQSQLQRAVQICGAPTTVWRNFWSAHQRCFRELAICAKVAAVAQDAIVQVQQKGRCVVIGLQSTGESGMQSLLDSPDHKNGRWEDERFPALLSTCSAVLTQFLDNHFPIRPFPKPLPKLPDPPSLTSSPQERQYYADIKAEIARLRALPPPQPFPELVERRQGLLASVAALHLPSNPLDDLIDQLGGVGQVAEMTGRSARMERPTPATHHFVYAKRATADDSDRINLLERRDFVDGRKPFCIISDAASTGISLHAARGSGGSHKRRVHYTIELPWSADKAVQQLGRSHRSGQESSPIYKLVVTNLGGERRFAAAVSKRMANLGALTKGDRRAATGSDLLSDFDLDSKYGKRALKRFYSALQNNQIHQGGAQAEQLILPTACLPSQNTSELLDQFIAQMIQDKDPMVASLPAGKGPKHSDILAMVTLELEQVGVEKEKVDVRVFLNRLAGLKVSSQTLVFSLFMSTLADVIKQAKATGEFEGTAEDIRATSIEIGSEEKVAMDPSSGVHTLLTTLVLDRGISFEAVSAMAMEEAIKDKTLKRQEAKNDPDVDETNYAPMAARGEMDGFIVDQETDEWFSTAKAKNRIASEGFYISRNKIAGRHLVLFARNKFDYSNFASEEAAANFDPMGWMIVSRPNTGTNMADLSSRDLERKYRLAFGCNALKQLWESNDNEVATPSEMVQRGCWEAADLWMTAYQESNHYKHHDGLAPRRQEVALVTGPVLHIMPALEKAVMMRSEKERALKIMRAQVGSRRIVGVRFPSDHEAIHSLKQELNKLQEARQSAGIAFIDEALPPICKKGQEWATTERKTMKSFFQVAANKPLSAASASRKNADAVTPTEGCSGAVKAAIFMASKRGSPAPNCTPTNSNKKARKLTCFFAKKH